MPEDDDQHTSYPVIADPPLDGAIHVSVTFAFPAVTLDNVGAEGTVDGFAFNCIESAEYPFTFFAFIAK